MNSRNFLDQDKTMMAEDSSHSQEVSTPTQNIKKKKTILEPKICIKKQHKNPIKDIINAIAKQIDHFNPKSNGATNQIQLFIKFVNNINFTRT